jgi:hypothetical protein
LYLQTTLKRSQGVQCINQGFVFLDGVVAAGKELTGSGDDGVLGFCNAIGKPIFIGLKQGGLIKLSPIFLMRADGRWVSHTRPHLQAGGFLYNH